ncbi:hypothetical protein BOX15_Mlig031582g1 [Macrostomum lignano]|uniref:BHLH domain-containing protein n=1 Tax=Macrostomum lignano TaxID=282301 RepID=A0A267GSH9_9PLAT|nr:hypothetical protein BOX15_Mlig031582g1 [Macrostomum lignano]
MADVDSKCGILYLSGCGDSGVYPHWHSQPQPLPGSDFIYINQPTCQVPHHQGELLLPQHPQQYQHQLADFDEQHQLYQQLQYQQQQQPPIFANSLPTCSAGYSSSPVAYLASPAEASDCSGGGFLLAAGTAEDDDEVQQQQPRLPTDSTSSVSSSLLTGASPPLYPCAASSATVPATGGCSGRNNRKLTKSASAPCGGEAATPGSGSGGGGGETKVKTPLMVAKRNARERRRVEAVNSAFARLRKYIPYEKRNKRLSKVKTLRITIEYIQLLQQVLHEFDSGVDTESSVNYQSLLQLVQRKELAVPLTD